MKFRVERDVLEEAVSSTARTLPTRPAVPVLAGIWITASQGVVSLFAFDYEMSVRNQFEAEVEEDGEVLVSGRMLASISKQLPKKPVEVQQVDGKVHISCGSIKFDLLTMALDEYPDPPEYPEVIGKVDGGAFAEAINQVAMASSRDDTLPLLATVRIELKGSTMTLMATDRYRLAVREMEWSPADGEVDASALIKARKLSEVGKSLNAGEQVELSLNVGTGTAAVFGVETAGQKMTTQLTDGEYPPVTSLFPEELPISAVVNRDDLIQALRRVSLVTEHSAQVRLNFTPQALTLDAGHGDDAQASEQLPCTFEGDESMSVAFNPTYLREGLSALNTEFARLAFTHPSKPAVITGQAEADSEELTDFRYLLMPIRYAG